MHVLSWLHGGNLRLHWRGAGKTTAALGLALRSVGQNHKVIIIQFMKGRKDVGEWKVKDALAPNYEIHQFGREEFMDLKKPEEVDYKMAREGLEFAGKVLERKPDLLVLDEVNLVVRIGLLKAGDVLKLLKKVPKGTDVVLTGRYAPQELLDAADFVNEVEPIKYPKEIVSKRGIQF